MQPSTIQFLCGSEQEEFATASCRGRWRRPPHVVLSPQSAAQIHLEAAHRGAHDTAASDRALRPGVALDRRVFEVAAKLLLGRCLLVLGRYAYRRVQESFQTFLQRAAAGQSVQRESREQSRTFQYRWSKCVNPSESP